MEKRLTAQGPADRKSYTVTLPIEWVRKEGLAENRTVDLTIVGRKVVISPVFSEDEVVSIDGDRYSKVLIKVLQAFYRAGIDEIKIKYSKTAIAEDVLNILEQKLIGSEVIEHTKNYIVIKDITKESEEDFKIVFRRLFLLLLELAESTDINHIRALKRNVDKLFNYCQRILMKKGHIEFRKTPLYYLMLDRLEKLGDEFYWMRKHSLGKSPSAMNELAQIFRNSYKLFYRFDSKQYAKNQQRSYDIMILLKPKELMAKKVMHTLNVARILNSLYGDIFAVHCDNKNLNRL